MPFISSSRGLKTEESGGEGKLLLVLVLLLCLDLLCILHIPMFLFLCLFTHIYASISTMYSYPSRIVVSYLYVTSIHYVNLCLHYQFRISIYTSRSIIYNYASDNFIYASTFSSILASSCLNPKSMDFMVLYVSMLVPLSISIPWFCNVAHWICSPFRVG